jgi:ubiquinone/menaquinone biosynthesis C-methylase UbiE
MQAFSKFKKYFSKNNPKPVRKDTDPEPAYDLWSFNYDEQPDNLILALDELLFTDLIKNITIENKIVADVGCGTGRHWKKIIEKKPAQLSGYDVSQGMLNILRQKFPNAITHRLTDQHLPGLADQSCDIVISTLAIAHIENIEEVLVEWSRVLKPGGSIIITDYHPVALTKGGDRTFKHNNELIAIKNYIHPIDMMKQLAAQLQFQVLNFTEKKIDGSVKHYYEKQKALHIFEQFSGTPIIYGMHLKKSHAVS